MHLFHRKIWNIDIEASNLASAAFQLGAEEKDIEILKTWTGEEYILKDIPIEFHSVLSSMAYQRGHNAGEKEVLSILSELAFDLKPAIEEFKKNWINKHL